MIARTFAYPATRSSFFSEMGREMIAPARLAGLVPGWLVSNPEAGVLAYLVHHFSRVFEHVADLPLYSNEC